MDTIEIKTDGAPILLAKQDDMLYLTIPGKPYDMVLELDPEHVIDALRALGVGEPVAEEYTDREWHGEEDAVIESETDPWIVDPQGNVMDFGGDALWGIAPGVLVCGSDVERDDTEGIFDGDLDAAQALATILNNLVQDGHTVWYHGA